MESLVLKVIKETMRRVIVKYGAEAFLDINTSFYIKADPFFAAYGRGIVDALRWTQETKVAQIHRRIEPSRN